MADLSGKDGERPNHAARENRMRKINQVLFMMPKKACYRSELVDHFCGRARQRRSLAVRILKWLFSSRSRVVRSAHCCDFCDRETDLLPMEYTASLLRAGG